MPKKKKIAVTGGAGFLGSHLCARLLNEGHAVLCIDNLYTGRRGNMTALSDRTGFRFLEHDITVPFRNPLEVDEIYNLACPASPVHYQRDPVATTKTSVLGILNLLELSVKIRAKLLQASTSEVYGNPEVHPQTETYWGRVNPIGVRSCYDEGKRCAESLCFDFHRTRNVKIKVARIFNTYGPFMDPLDGRVVSNFIVQALKNEPVTIYGKGLQTRSFCYVDDLIDGLIRLMESPDNLTGPVNLGNPNEFNMIDICRKIISLTG